MSLNWQQLSFLKDNSILMLKQGDKMEETYTNMKYFIFKFWFFKMVRILISLSSAFQSYQWKSVFPKVLKWLSCVFQGFELQQSIKNAASCIHFQCPLEKCTFTWGGVQLMSFVPWKDTVIPCSLKGSVVMAAVRQVGLCACTEMCIRC